MIAASLFGVLVVARLLMLAGGAAPLSPWSPLVFLWQDCVFVVLVALVEQATRRRPRVGWSLYGVVVVYVAINVPVACVLSTPLTWPLLKATGGTLADSIFYYATAANVLRVGLVLLTAVVLPLWLRSRWPRLSPRLRGLTLPALLLLALIGQAVAGRVETLGLHRNVFVALIGTALPRVSARDVAGEWRVSPFGRPAEDDLSGLRGKAAGKNVLIVHLESTGARYLRHHGAAEDPMPTLTALAGRSLVFERAYTTFPETIKSFAAVHNAVQPALDVPVRSYAELPSPGLASILRLQGYRTGLFHSGRFAYLGMDAVVRGQGFQTCEDAGHIGGEHDSSFGIDEPSTVDRLLRWLDESPGRPFLACYLPIAGHHPYATPTAGGPFPEDTEIGRYRNALRYADDALARLLHGLRERGLEESTLIVVCGDHGQAFGQHPGNFGHTLFLYEENVHVPLLFAVPGVTDDGARTSRQASLADVTPTVLELLGLEGPGGYDGATLLTGPRRLALFCTDYGLGLLGLRDGRWKAIHQVESGRTYLFDLDADPGETRDVAGEHPARVEAYREHLLDWCAAQRFKLEASR